MSAEAYITFILMTSILFAAPGPAVLFSVRNGLVHGVRRSLAGVCGNACALFLMVCLTAFGLSYVLSLSDPVFKLLKVAGALYLIYLGIRMWNAPIISSLGGKNASVKATTNNELFLQGFLLTSSNPKAYVFLSGLLPQFLNIEHQIGPQIVLLAPTITLVQVFTFTAYIVLSSYAANWIIGGRRLRAINRISGATLIGCGALMANAR